MIKSGECRQSRYVRQLFAFDPVRYDKHLKKSLSIRFFGGMEPDLTACGKGSTKFKRLASLDKIDPSVG